MEGGERREEPSEFEVNSSFHLYNTYILNDESPLSNEKTRRRTAFVLHIKKGVMNTQTVCNIYLFVVILHIE